MLLPTHLLPSALGWVWGLSVAECIARLHAPPVFRGERRIEFPLLLAGHQRRLQLAFYDPAHLDYYWQDAAGHKYGLWGTRYDAADQKIPGAGEVDDTTMAGLYRIQTCLHESQFLFHADPQDADLHATRDRVSLEYHDRYAELVAAYSAILGGPAFSGALYNEVETALGSTWVRNPAFPVEYGAIHLTYWPHPEGRLLLELQQQDTELPLTIDLACWRTADPP